MRVIGQMDSTESSPGWKQQLLEYHKKKIRGKGSVKKNHLMDDKRNIQVDFLFRVVPLRIDFFLHFYVLLKNLVFTGFSAYSVVMSTT